MNCSCIPSRGCLSRRRAPTLQENRRIHSPHAELSGQLPNVRAKSTVLQSLGTLGVTVSRIWSFFSAGLLVFLAAACGAQDIKVRQEAETLLEQANSLVVPRELGTYLHAIAFRVFDPSGIKEGQFTSVFQGPRSYRNEYKFEDFDIVLIVNGETSADIGSDRNQAPLPIRRLTRLNRPYSARFDQTDVIHSIQDSEVNGRPARCIEFDTTKGEKIEVNELCIDKRLRVVARVHANNETITFSDYFSYRGTLMPGHIVYQQNDFHMEIDQTKTELEGPVNPDLLTAPPQGRLGHACKAFRRPFGQFMPQPRPGYGGQNVDVIIHGVVRANGSVSELSVDASKREDLNQEAIQVCSGWRFIPASCDGAVVEVPVDITLHFQGR